MTTSPTITTPTEQALLTVKPLSAKRICDMFVGAFEGGSNYWAHTANWTKGNYDPKARVIWWGQEGFWESDWEIVVEFDDEKKTLTPDMVLAGQQLMINQYPHRWAEITNENDDAETADVFLQLCLFGDIVYG